MSGSATTPKKRKPRIEVRRFARTEEHAETLSHLPDDAPIMLEITISEPPKR